MVVSLQMRAAVTAQSRYILGAEVCREATRDTTKNGARRTAPGQRCCCASEGMSESYLSVVAARIVDAQSFRQTECITGESLPGVTSDDIIAMGGVSKLPLHPSLNDAQEAAMLAFLRSESGDGTGVASPNQPRFINANNLSTCTTPRTRSNPTPLLRRLSSSTARASLVNRLVGLRPLRGGAQPTDCSP